MYGKSTINRGDIWAVDLDPAQGSEANKIRPCLVVTNDTANSYADVITVVSLSTTPPKKHYPFMVEVPDTARMPKESWVDCAHIRAVDKSRLRKYYTSLDSSTVSKVDAALRAQLSLNPKSTRA